MIKTVFNFTKQQLTWIDGLILIAAILWIMILFYIYWGNGQPAEYAMLFLPEGPPQRIDLHHARTFSVPGRLGESIIEVKNGKIRFIHSPCRGKYCIHHGWQTQGGDFVACLPNEVSISVHSEASTQFDAIAY